MEEEKRRSIGSKVRRRMDRNVTVADTPYANTGHIETVLRKIFGEIL